MSELWTLCITLLLLNLCLHMNFYCNSISRTGVIFQTKIDKVSNSKNIDAKAMDIVHISSPC